MLKSCVAVDGNSVQNLAISPQAGADGLNVIQVIQSFSDQILKLFSGFPVTYPHLFVTNLPREPGGLSTLSTGPIINTTILKNQSTVISSEDK